MSVPKSFAGIPMVDLTAPEPEHPPGSGFWRSPEGIDIKQRYTAADLAGLDALDTYPGLPPFLRGPYSTMYLRQPWTIRQYAGFSTAEASASVAASTT